MPSKHTIKCVVLGNYAVGKSSIVQTYIHKIKPNAIKATIGAQFSCINYRISDQIVKINLWDTAGEERFRSILSLYYRNADICMIVLDLSSNNHLQSIVKWYDILKHSSNAILILVGNKLDLIPNEVKEFVVQKVKLTAQENGINFVEFTTTKNIDSIIHLFDHTLRESILESQQSKIQFALTNTTDQIYLSNGTQNINNGYCCKFI